MGCGVLRAVGFMFALLLMPPSFPRGAHGESSGPLRACPDDPAVSESADLTKARWSGARLSAVRLLQNSGCQLAQL
eukprot:9260737-Pyramimonas_sp.AAC.1